MFWLPSVALAIGVAVVVAAVGVRAAVVTALATLVVWVAGLTLIVNGWRDIDGFVDCNRHCDSWHWLGAMWFLTPPLVFLALVVVAAILTLRRRLAA
jgi:hypothetical protein